MVLTPTYHVFDMYQAFMGATAYTATAMGRTMPPASCRWWMSSAARGKDGKLYLSMVNTDPAKPAHVVTNLTGAAMAVSSPDPPWTATTASKRPMPCIPWHSAG